MRRRSITGPLILILIGVLFLTRNLWHQMPLFPLLAMYWPFVLIAWGLLRLIEVLVEAGRGKPVRSGLSGGEVALVILLCFIGSGLYAANRHGYPGRFGPLGARSLELFGAAYDYHSSDHKPATEKSRIVFENLRGNVRVNGGDAKEVRVDEHKTIRSFDKSDADQADRNTPLEIVMEGGRIVVRTNQERVSNNRRISADLDVSVPRGVSIEARAAYGDFDIADIGGDVDINSGNAGVRLNKIGGNAKIEVHRSDIVRAVDMKGNVDVQGRGGDIDLENILGQVTINGSFPGTLEFKKLGKPLHFESRQTDLSVAGVPGSITMDLREFNARNIIGPMRFVTRSRDIKIEEFTQSLELETQSGDIELRPVKVPLAKIDVRCRSGNLELSLPESAKFDLRASTSRGEAQNDYGSPIQVETEGHLVSLKGTVGKGPSITMSTDRGRVTVKKESREGSSSEGEVKPTKL